MATSRPLNESQRWWRIALWAMGVGSALSLGFLVLTPSSGWIPGLGGLIYALLTLWLTSAVATGLFYRAYRTSLQEALTLKKAKIMCIAWLSLFATLGAVWLILLS